MMILMSWAQERGRYYATFNLSKTIGGVTTTVDTTIYGDKPIDVVAMLRQFEMSHPALEEALAHDGATMRVATGTQADAKEEQAPETSAEAVAELLRKRRYVPGEVKMSMVRDHKGDTEHQVRIEDPEEEGNLAYKATFYEESKDDSHILMMQDTLRENRIIAMVPQSILEKEKDKLETNLQELENPQTLNPEIQPNVEEQSNAFTQENPKNPGLKPTETNTNKSEKDAFVAKLPHLRIYTQPITQQDPEVLLFKEKERNHLNSLSLREISVSRNSEEKNCVLKFGTMSLEKSTLLLEVLDTEGNAIYKEKVKKFKGNYHKVIDLPYDIGIYIISIRQNDRMATRRLMME